IATASASDGSSSVPLSIVPRSALYAGFGRRAFISCKPNVFSPKISSMFMGFCLWPLPLGLVAGVQFFPAASVSKRRVLVSAIHSSGQGLGLRVVSRIDRGLFSENLPKRHIASDDLC